MLFLYTCNFASLLASNIHTPYIFSPTVVQGNSVNNYVFHKYVQNLHSNKLYYDLMQCIQKKSDTYLSIFSALLPNISWQITLLYCMNHISWSFEVHLLVVRYPFRFVWYYLSRESNWPLWGTNINIMCTRANYPLVKQTMCLGKNTVSSWMCRSKPHVSSPSGLCFTTVSILPHFNIYFFPRKSHLFFNLSHYIFLTWVKKMSFVEHSFKNAMVQVPCF
jgi:hypothetical protein